MFFKKNKIQQASDNTNASLVVKILGGGCANCNQLEKNAITALKNLNIDARIVHVKDYAVIASMGVMATPALAINDKVVSSGKVLVAGQIEQLLLDATNAGN